MRVPCSSFPEQPSKVTISADKSGPNVGATRHGRTVPMRFRDAMEIQTLYLDLHETQKPEIKKP